MKGWKYRSRQLLKAIFCHQRNNKRADRLCMKFSSTSNTSVQWCLYPPFQNQRPSFLLPPLFWRLYQPSSQDQKVVNEDTLDYHTSRSESTSKRHPLIFSWTSNWFISPEYSLNYFSNLYIPSWLWKNFKFMVLRLLKKTFVSQKIKSVHFYSYPKAKLSPGVLSSPSRQ